MFISFEGPDGSGKSSQIPDLANKLQKAGYEVLLTREPGGTEIGDQVRKVLFDMHNNAMHPRSETLLFLASRTQLVEEVIRPLRKLMIAVCLSSDNLSHGVMHGYTREERPGLGRFWSCWQQCLP